MTDFQLAAIVLSLTAALAYLNARLVRLPASVGLMAIALLISLALLALDRLGVDVGHARALVNALHLDVASLGSDKLAVTALALGGTALSTLLIGGATALALSAIGLPIRPVD